MDNENHYIDLKEKGYIFKLKIMGRFGNLLLQMENLLLLAKNTQSIIAFPKRSKFIRIPFSKKIDFRSPENNNCNKIITGEGHNFVFKSPYKKHLFADKDNWCLNYLHNLINDVPTQQAAGYLRS